MTETRKKKLSRGLPQAENAVENEQTAVKKKKKKKNQGFLRSLYLL
jgi:hypothetical protein